MFLCCLFLRLKLTALHLERLNMRPLTGNHHSLSDKNPFILRRFEESEITIRTMRLSAYLTKVFSVGYGRLPIKSEKRGENGPLWHNILI